MINITRKEECCGCKACGDICTKNSITFHTDEEGNWYPMVNMETCIDCGLCEKVCPILHPDFRDLGNFENPETYILQAPSLEDRLASASGAAYTLLVKAVYEKGGYVAGHVWKDKVNVVGFVSGDPKNIDILRGTKYLQSDTEGMFKAVRSLLSDNKFVLFSGCPCQVAAMRRYLRTDCENLITTDFTCMGIDSPLAFAKYIESLEKRFGAEMVYFKAKAKDVGWTNLTNKARFANGKSYFGICSTDANLRATFLNVLVRPSCYECQFKGIPRIADITIGDYWRKVHSYDPLDDNTGTSYVILNNLKAQFFFEPIKEKCHFRKVTISEILGANALVLKSLPRPIVNRKDFYKNILENDFSTVVDDFISYKSLMSASSVLRRIVRTLLTELSYSKGHIPSLLQFFTYNILSRNIKTNIMKGNILYVNRTKISTKDNARIRVNGTCFIGNKQKSTLIELGEGSELILNNNIIKSGCLLQIIDKCTLMLDYHTVIESNVTIKTRSSIKIKDFCLILNNVEINDSDDGIIFFDADNPEDKSIYIGTHTLIEQGCIIKGSTYLGDETVVKAYSSVKGQFEPLSVLKGIPAQVIDNNKCWKYNF